MKTQLAATLAGVLLLAAASHATTPSINLGSLGAAANGTNADGVTLNLAGPLAAPGDFSIGYSGGTNTVVPYNAALNPLAASPFSIEFWAMPSSSDNDDTPVSNRVHSGNRSGWVFFQRAAGWNFRMYNGNSGTVGLELTGGSSTIGAWSHVVAVWDGATPKLYVNGLDTAATVTGAGGYAVNPAGTNFALGAHDYGGGGASPYEGRVDETAYYGTALSAIQIAGHYSAASSATPGAYSSLVQSDGALLYLSNVPEPASAGLILMGLTVALMRRRK